MDHQIIFEVDETYLVKDMGCEKKFNEFHD